MQAFNSQFRNIEKATNVLSFPSVQLDWRRLVEFVPSDMSGYYFLGDIAFGYEIIHAEALNCGISVQDHFMHLLVHAILHLIGFDHQDEEEAEVMEELEISILKDFGVNSPY
jgi:probable rRNA maturation factor